MGTDNVRFKLKGPRRDSTRFMMRVLQIVNVPSKDFVIVNTIIKRLAGMANETTCLCQGASCGRRLSELCGRSWDRPCIFANREGARDRLVT